MQDGKDDYALEFDTIEHGVREPGNKGAAYFAMYTGECLRRALDCVERRIDCRQELFA
jgi:hypothetical protein